MAPNVIQVQDLSKLYRLGEVGTGTLSHDLKRWWHKVRGKEDPYLTVGATNDRTVKGGSDYVWALKDINFNVAQGEIVGIIGRNGAGKSTLLKILSRTTSPTTGNIKIKGRVASLLEVGTGFHPELTGRDNIYLNGAILGMTRREIKSKFDEIISFAGVERYVDTPVKRYSSGMYVRLAFAVAAHLESEILVVDEVLAVGDTEFQKKCLGKMGQISKGEGRTVLFVSHNMNAIKTLCRRSVVMQKGTVAYIGDVHTGIEIYSSPGEKRLLEGTYLDETASPGHLPVVLRAAKTCDVTGSTKSEFECDDDIYVHLDVEIIRRQPGLRGYIVVRNASEEVYIETDTNDHMPNVLNNLQQGLHSFVLKLDRRVLPAGEFYLYLNFSNDFEGFYELGPGKDILKFNITDSNTHRGNLRRGLTSAILKWELSQIETYVTG